MDSIFEEGHLRPECINPNYRGLVGWKCRGKIHRFEEEIDLTLVALAKYPDSGFICAFDISGQVLRKSLKIKRFSGLDIPVGELCWFANGGSHQVDGECYWVLRPVTQTDIDKYTDTGKDRWNEFGNMRLVPYLIAGTWKKAWELMGDWSK
jgi:hypothetical protein